MLTRTQNFIEAGDRKENEIQVRFDILSGILNRHGTTHNELKLSDDTDHYSDIEKWKLSITSLRQNSKNSYTTYSTEPTTKQTQLTKQLF